MFQKFDQSLLSVYKLGLSSDGSLSKDGKYIRLPPPVKPYILRFNVRAGTLVSNNGTLYTNYPVDE